MPESYEGVVVTWREDRGFGFIKPDKLDGPDIFVHRRDLLGNDALIEGDKVTFELEKDNTGRKLAVKVEGGSARRTRPDDRDGKLRGGGGRDSRSRSRSRSRRRSPSDSRRKKGGRRRSDSRDDSRRRRRR
eukprot:TRINITY_DN24827_c1_g1_i1.p1 TRINITY_DN24827_c1_g1~~TRINITY_DN24827_c1_g1_i1.p1  ORF type:complete len:131 (+),score=18.70 TRINITY_DN24827_c1_g1_i1:93-485(+)